jgi:lipopolysaccharide export system permease protein
MTRAAGARNRNFMKLIERYLFRQLLGPTLAASAALAGVALLSSSLGQLELIVDQGQSATVFATLTLLALPQLLSLVLPIAIFVASLIALNRLQTEQELVVCFASGMSRWRVIAPVVRLAAVVALLILALNLFVQPVAARMVREQMFQIRTDLAATLIREGDFSTPSGELTVYAQRTERDGRLLNIFIHEERPQGPRTVIAKEGRLVQRAAGPALLLRVGSSEEYDSSGVLNFTQFSLNTFDLAPFVNTEEKLHYKISDRWMHELVFPDLRHDWERHNRTKMLAEAHSRLAAPLYSFTFVMLALSAVVGGQFNRLGYNRRIVYAAAVAGVTRILGFGALAACNDSAALNVLQYAIPVGVMYAAYADLFRRRSTGQIRSVGEAGPTPLVPIGASA